MFERYLIEYCSPTLASLKTASLFSLKFTDDAELLENLRIWNENFVDKGVMLMLLQKSENRGLVYVCRKRQLLRDLERPGVARFLETQGYDATDAKGALEILQSRLGQSCSFPHEIGIFLGYPLGDVIGFIQNGGRNAKCTGCWKVYCNECEAVKAFARFKKCRDVYLRLWQEGRSVLQLTVAA